MLAADSKWLDVLFSILAYPFWSYLYQMKRLFHLNVFKVRLRTNKMDKYNKYLLCSCRIFDAHSGVVLEMTI